MGQLVFCARGYMKKIDQVIIDGLRSERARHTAQLADLTEQLAQAQQECDEHVENLSRCKGNELAEQLAQAQAEIEDWRSKFQRALTR